MKQTWAYSALTLAGNSTVLEDAVFIDPNEGCFLLVDAASVHKDVGRDLARETVQSFRIRKNNLTEWLLDWNRQVFGKMKDRVWRERATASLLVGQARQDEAWEWVALGSVGLWRLGGFAPQRVFHSLLPTETLGVYPTCQVQHGFFSMSQSEWLVAGSGGFLEESRWGGLRDFLALQDAKQRSFRDSAKHFVEENAIQVERNSTLLLLGRNS